MAEIAGTLLSLPFYLLGGGSARDWLDIITFSDLKDSLSHGRNARLVEAYGLLRTVLLLWYFPDGLDVIDRIERDVLRGTKAEGAMRTRDAFCAKYNMTAVAAAIIAQVAITALSLDQIESTHWTVQAAFIISLVTGCLSVFYCCVIQHSFGTLISPEDIKDWLCKPGEWHDMERELNDMDELDRQFRSWKPGSESTATREDLRALRNKVLGQLNADRWKMPWINAAIMLVAPVRLLYLSVLSFLAGLGIYLSLVFSEKLVISAGPTGSEALLIIYVLILVFGLLLFYVPTGLKRFEHIPGDRVRREASHVKHMLDAYQSLEELESILTDISRRSDNGVDGDVASGEVKDRLEQLFSQLLETLMALSKSNLKPSQEALKQLMAKLREVNQRFGPELNLYRDEAMKIALTRGRSWNWQDILKDLEKDSKSHWYSRKWWKSADSTEDIMATLNAAQSLKRTRRAITFMQPIGREHSPMRDNEQNTEANALNRSTQNVSERYTGDWNEPPFARHRDDGEAISPVDPITSETLRLMVTAQQETVRTLEKLVGSLDKLEQRLSVLSPPSRETHERAAPTADARGDHTTASSRPG